MRRLIGQIWRHHAAKKRFSRLPAGLGLLIKKQGNHVFLFPEYGVTSFPVKGHWREPATLELIEQSCQELIKLWEGNADEVVSIRPGCGLGRPAWTTVKPILEKYLDDRFTIVDRGG